MVTFSNRQEKIILVSWRKLLQYKTLLLEYWIVVHENRGRLWLAGNNDEFYKRNTLKMRIADSTVYHIYHGSWPSTYNDSAIEIYWPLIERFCLATGHGSVIRTADDNTRSQARQIQPFLYFQLRTLTLAECRSQLNRSSLLSLTLSLSASDFKSELNGSLEIEIHGNSIF